MLSHPSIEEEIRRRRMESAQGIANPNPPTICPHCKLDLLTCSIKELYKHEEECERDDTLDEVGFDDGI